MKDYKCDACSVGIQVTDDYEPEFCCPGRMEDMCGCHGKPINPVFCDDCEFEIFGHAIDEGRRP